MQRILLRLIVAAAALQAAALARADGRIDSWPQWRGPAASGVSETATPPTTWSDEENIRWKVAVPFSGLSSPIVWNDRIYIQTAIELPRPEGEAAEEEPPEEPARPGRGGRGGRFGRRSAPPAPHQFVVMCLDRATGETIWSRVATEETPHEGHHPDHGFASASAATDGECLVAYFGSRGLFCYDLDGNLQWEKDLGDMQTRNSFGEGSSPTLHGDYVVVTWDHEGDDDFTAVFDKRTGDELWRQAREEPTTWATPLVVEQGGRAQVVTPGTNRLRSYDLATGEMIWEYDGLTTNAIPSPVVSAEGIAYLMSGFRGSELVAVNLHAAAGDLTGSDAIVWTHDRDTPYVPSPLLHRDRLYFCKSNNAILSCMNAKTGETLFGPERIDGLDGVYSSPVAAGDYVYLFGRDGAAVVITASDTLEIVAENKLSDRIDASPALVGDALLVRGHEYLYCIADD